MGKILSHGPKTIDFEDGKCAEYIICDDGAYMYERPAEVIGAMISLSQMRPDETLMAPGVIYRRRGVQAGDIVTPVSDEFQLACGSSRYGDAVVLSMDPFVLVSRCSTMRWEHTVRPEQFKTIAIASEMLLAGLEHRING